MLKRKIQLKNGNRNSIKIKEFLFPIEKSNIF